MPFDTHSAALTQAVASLHDRLTRLTASARVAAGDSDVAPVQILDRLVEPLDCAALVADNTARFVVTNLEATRLTGYTRRELRRLSMWQITPGPRDHEAETLWRAFLTRGEQTGEYPVCTKDGREVVAAYAAAAHVLPGLHVSLLDARLIVAAGR